MISHWMQYHVCDKMPPTFKDKKVSSSTWDYFSSQLAEAQLMEKEANIKNEQLKFGFKSSLQAGTRQTRLGERKVSSARVERERKFEV